MKVILIGSSGFIGREILSQCLANPNITSIIAVSRHELPVSDPKIRNLIHSDFSSYPAALLEELQDADACIYTMGTVSPDKPDFNRRVNMDYTLAAANAFATQHRDGTKKFRFVYCSGHFTEKAQGRRLWIMSENRKMRGEVELQLLELGRENAAAGFEVRIARPGFVQPKDAKVKMLVVGTVFKAIRVDLLAAGMIRMAVEGAGDTLCENDTLAMLGKAK